MNNIFFAHRITLPQQVDWTGFVLSACTVLMIGILGVIWHHRSPATTKRTFRFYLSLTLICISTIVLLLSLVYKSMHGPSIEDTFIQLSKQSPESLKQVLKSMILLSKESLYSRKERVILGTEKRRIPESINRLQPNSIYLKRGEVQILLNKQSEESLSLLLRQRGDDYYMLLNYKNERSRKNLDREIHPHSRIEELVEQKIIESNGNESSSL